MLAPWWYNDEKKPKLTLSLVTANGVDIVLAGLEVGKVTSLIVNVENLLATLIIESSELLAGRGTESLLEVRVQTGPGSGTLVRNTVLGIEALCLLGGLVLAVECLESRGKAGTDTVLLVEGEGALNGVVADGVSVCEVLSDDARARLVLLGNVL